MGKFREITLSELKEHVSFNSETGEFTRIKPTKRIDAGEPIGRISADGYVIIYIGWIPYLAHRLAWLYVNGELPAEYIDHINGDRADNRICNLRAANKKENLWNMKRHKDNKSGFKGVHFHKQNGKWRAQGMVNGRKHHLGLFDTPEEAHEAYCKFSKEAFGEYARAA